MAKSALRKLKNGGGLSLTELLLCMIILLFFLNVSTYAFDLGIRHFKARTLESEARILCNTLSLAVQDQLTYMKVRESTFSGDKLETYVRSAEGFSGVTCSLEVADGRLYVKYALNATEYQFLLTDEADYADGDLMVDDFSVTKSGNAFQVVISIASKKLKIQPVRNEFAVTPIYPEALTQS